MRELFSDRIYIITQDEQDILGNLEKILFILSKTIRA